MNAKFLVSLMIIGLAAIGMITGGTMTGAFFSDTEVSENNTFIAGTLDLWLDMVLVNGSIAVYNGENMQIFNVSDIKPGDRGEKTISLHVDNDAWLCVYVNYSEAENGCNEPEALEDSTCGVGDNAELDEEMNLLIWWDDGEIDGWQCGKTPRCDSDTYEGDNIYQPGYEDVYYNGTVSNLTTMSPGPYPINASTVCYMGIEWSVDSDVGNIIQGDSVVLNALFYAEQQKNNGNFTCALT